MYVCLCHGVTEREVRRAAEEGCSDVHELTMRTGCGSVCGSCLPLASEILAQVHAPRLLPLTILRAA
ncbi:MAG: (2Fe-2S)-binding protein [Arenimonas sp.]